MWMAATLRRALAAGALLLAPLALVPIRADAGPMPANARVIFLHHSTGGVIWGGGVPGWIDSYNSAHGTSYSIAEQAFPEGEYPWENYPYDYWNIWVSHAGTQAYMGQPTLQMLTPQYDVIVFKHCFPVSGIGPDTGSPDIASPEKTLENYKLQYGALKTALRAFPAKRFIVWTGAALRAEDTSPEQAARAQQFFAWVRTVWDEPGDNIFVWDFFDLETDGGMYLTPEHASGDSHPNDAFAAQVAPLFAQRVVDVIEGRGDSTDTTHAPLPGPAPSLALASANPASHVVRFAVELPAEAHVELVIRDVAGRRVALLINQRLTAGTRQFTWDGHATGVPAGVYFATLRAGDHQVQRRIALLE